MTLELDRHLSALLHHRETPCITLYLPLRWDQPRQRANEIALKNLLRRAEELLDSEEGVADRVLKPLRSQLLDALATVRPPALVAFHSPSLTRIVELPAKVDPIAVVEDRFHLKPLLAMANQRSEFAIWALSPKRVRALRCSESGVVELDLTATIPTSLSEFLGDVHAEPELQLHSTAAGGSAPVYHGHDDNGRRQTAELERFLRAVDRGLGSLSELDRLPVVLAGDKRLLRTFHDVTEHGDRVISELHGNMDHTSPHDLLVPAREALAAQRARERDAMLDALSARAPSGRCCTGLDQVLPAADDGRVETLLLAGTRRVWGRYDRLAHGVTVDQEQTAENEDLLDLAAVRTYEQGGNVMLVEPGALPGDAHAAALLRF